MSEHYAPRDKAIPAALYTTRFLSQRDLSLAVPINFVTTPGVSLSSACFSKLKFDSNDAALCLSNLLAIGFRRFEIDIYWDEILQVWSFCPVAQRQPDPSSSSAPAPSSSSVSSDALGSSSSPAPTLSSDVVARQVLPTSESTSLGTATSDFSTSLNGGTSLGQSPPTYTAVPDTPDNPQVTYGPYTCSTSIGLSLLTTLLSDYIDKTEDTLAASLLYIIVNIHAVASSVAPTLPAPLPVVFPDSDKLLGSQFSGNLTKYLYTPELLHDDRENLNNSWYRVSESYRPPEGYYKTSSNDIISTEDGWPSEGYIEFSKSKRLLLGFGHVDPQMASYNFSVDDDKLFPSGFIQSIQSNLAASSAGELTAGCLFRSSTSNTSQANSSWAVGTSLPGFSYPTTSDGDLDPTFDLVSNLNDCGISPLLNTTLLDQDADTNIEAYQRYAYSTIWSWGPDEPRNYTTELVPDPLLFRCAVSVPPFGRWIVSDCSTKNYAACRSLSQPYNWTMATYPVSYAFASSSCPDGYTFATPRTALENAHLARAITTSKLPFTNRTGPWVNLNSLHLEGCWVTGGANATCPYADNYDWNLHQRQILVPTVAAIIVLIITALTVFAKAAGNRSQRKRKGKRAYNGFVYEGVPS